MEHNYYIATAYAAEFTKECMDKLFTALPENVAFMCSTEGLAFYHTRSLKGDELKTVKVAQNQKDYYELKNNIRFLENNLKTNGSGFFDGIARQVLDSLYSKLANWPHEEVMEADMAVVREQDAQLREFYQQKVNEAGFGDY